MDFIAAIGNGLRSAFGPTAAAYALLAIGLNMHYGYTGLLNFGQVGFMLVGAYGVGITVATLGWSMWIGILVGMLAAVGLALILGVPTLRLRADYFAITTIAVAEVLRLLVRSGWAQPLTGGPFGLQSIADEFYAINPFPTGTYGVGMLVYTNQQLWVLLVTWALALLMTLLLVALIRSPWGRVIKAIREDEDAARALGKNVFNYKMQSLVIGGVIGALGGSMYAIAVSSANADTYFPQITFFAYTILILGGAASRFGPMLGSVIFWFLYSLINALMRQAGATGNLPEFLTAGGATGAVVLTLIGLALMLLMIFRPQGILGNRQEMMLNA
jgi:neutral amino acid transport system permease protein